MKCNDCPVAEAPCLGEQVARLCVLAATRPDYRRLLVERARVGEGSPEAGPRAAPSPEDLAAVAACPDRGSVLPHTLQPECGCAELTECRAGRGAPPGRVTLRDCLTCITTQGG